MSIEKPNRRRPRLLLPLLLAAALSITAIALRGSLLAWFREARPPAPAAPLAPGAGHDHSTHGAAAPRGETAGGQTAEPPGSAGARRAAPGAIAYYTCSMHPSVRRHGPGTCPICSMDLTPVTVEELETGAITIDAGRRQLIGVRTGFVTRGPLAVSVRAVGLVRYDETRLADVSLKYQGWVRSLAVNQTGQPVRAGEQLFTLYSPDLYAAQEEYLTALAAQRAARAGASPERADYLVAAARRRLRLWDIADTQIAELGRRGSPWEAIPILSPATGFVIEKNVVEGAAVEPGARLYRTAALDPVWVEAEVYESELGLVAVGQPATITVPSEPGRRMPASVTFVYPYLDPRTRTLRVRLEVPNADLTLRPDMYVDVQLTTSLGERLIVPESAVLYAGPRRLVFVDLGEGRLEPREIEVGAKGEGGYEVLTGLDEGERVVVSGTFLVAAESRLKTAAESWR
jgi:Cu(I)/Ag(I) efflux system membrane fusion protein